MMTSVLARLIVLPGLAALCVGAIAILSVSDLKSVSDVNGPLKTAEPEDTEALQVLRSHRNAEPVPRTTEVPKLSEPAALKALEEGPQRAAVAALWPMSQHRDRLLKLLLSHETQEEIRLYLLSALEAESPKRAAEAARSILAENDLSQGPLLLAMYEVLWRTGEEKDLFELADKPFELHQTTTIREGYRASLHDRLHGRE